MQKIAAVFPICEKQIYIPAWKCNKKKRIYNRLACRSKVRSFLDINGTEPMNRSFLVIRYTLFDIIVRWKRKIFYCVMFSIFYRIGGG